MGRSRASRPAAPLSFDLAGGAIILETNLAVSSARELLVAAMWSARSERPQSAEWVGYLAGAQPHWRGLSPWLAFPESVSRALDDAVQEFLETNGAEGEREMGMLKGSGFQPTVRVSSDGLELLVPAPLAGEERRTMKVGAVICVIRGYFIVT